MPKILQFGAEGPCEGKFPVTLVALKDVLFRHTLQLVLGASSMTSIAVFNDAQGYCVLLDAHNIQECRTLLRPSQ
jgi:hypothetical protein